MAQKNRVQLGKTETRIFPIGLGCAVITDFYGHNKLDQDAATKLIHRALQLGVNFFDTALVYSWGLNEQILGKAIRAAISSGLIKREDVIIGTKYGFIKQEDGTTKISSTPEAVRQVVEQSLKNLDLGYIDLLYQHRVDAQTPIEDTIKTAAEYVKAGKVKYLGLSEASAATLRRAHAVHPITAVQTEYSLWELEPETTGIIDTCRELGVTFVAYAPLGRGFLTGSIKSFDDFAPDDVRRQIPRFHPENFHKNLELVDKIKKLAEKKGCTPSQLALAWISHKPGIVAIPGTTRIANLEENVAAFDIRITDEEEKEIRKILGEIPVSGARYPGASLTVIS